MKNVGTLTLPSGIVHVSVCICMCMCLCGVGVLRWNYESVKNAHIVIDMVHGRWFCGHIDQLWPNGWTDPDSSKHSLVLAKVALTLCQKGSWTLKMVVSACTHCRYPTYILFCRTRVRITKLWRPSNNTESQRTSKLLIYSNLSKRLKRRSSLSKRLNRWSSLLTEGCLWLWLYCVVTRFWALRL